MAGPSFVDMILGWVLKLLLLFSLVFFIYLPNHYRRWSLEFCSCYLEFEFTITSMIWKLLNGDNLSCLLSWIGLRNLDDYWSWPLVPSNNFSVKSLIEALVGTPTLSPNNLYSVIWNDTYPKKIKIFVRELSLGAVNMT